ncbi:hypothetical protein FOCC_FOCC003163 [Frankliniella occidentalis]|uniref:AarF domain-containing kinase 1 n=1 Tax=Frankliniella occidentalis TaxID=133901 RepID=A0A6J1SWU0_FRAOC|nr:aarF domain-containing kinase 1 [Frankliniella occidentalis]KAE8750039.1 hypothetical protein FOCC_FOCC003163 [Frankliniella occidentalis]
MWPARRILKYATVVGTLTGTAFSLHANQYNIDSIGAVRLGRAASTVLKISYLYKTELYSSNLPRDTPEFLELKSKVHRKAAENLLELCCANRGVFVKVGQHIGALEYILPHEYVETMKVLHSQAPTSSFEEIQRVLRQDLKCDPKEIFEEFSPTPLGAASLAQVHKAKLKDGTTVAVKVQHPYIKGNSTVDMTTMEALVKLVEIVFPDFRFQWLVTEMKRNIPMELNFLQEAENAEKASKMFHHFPWLKVPKVYWDLSNHRVLTMEYVEGGQVNDLPYIQENKIDPYEVSHKLGCLYSQMIFGEGFVHSDPHPGNILVKKNKQSNKVEVILLDHGLYADLTNQFRWEYSKLWLSILNSDIDGMKTHSQNLGVGEMWPLFACMVSGRTWNTIMSGVDKVNFTDSEKNEFQKEIPKYLPQITGVLQDVDRQMLLIFRTNDLMRGIEHTLKTHARMSSFLVMSRWCVRSVFNEQLKDCDNRIRRWCLKVAQQWTLLKISIYYAYMSVCSLSLSSMWQVMTS